MAPPTKRYDGSARVEEEKSPREVVEVKPEVKLPVVESIGMQKTVKGWVVVWLRTQGDKVLEADVLTEPGSRALGMERFKIECVRRVLAVGGGLGKEGIA